MRRRVRVVYQERIGGNQSTRVPARRRTHPVCSSFGFAKTWISVRLSQCLSDPNPKSWSLQPIQRSSKVRLFSLVKECLADGIQSAYAALSFTAYIQATRRTCHDANRRACSYSTWQTSKRAMRRPCRYSTSFSSLTGCVVGFISPSAPNSQRVAFAYRVVGWACSLPICVRNHAPCSSAEE